jgi:hypothetical protein
MKLTNQQQKVYDYILDHPGATTHDIQFGTWISCPSARITEMRQLGVQIISVGQKKYGNGTHPFEMYAIAAQNPKQLVFPIERALSKSHVR